MNVTAQKVAKFEANFSNEWQAEGRDETGKLVWVCRRIGKEAAIAACKAKAPTHTKNGF